MTHNKLDMKANGQFSENLINILMERWENKAEMPNQTEDNIAHLKMEQTEDSAEESGEKSDISDSGIAPLMAFQQHPAQSLMLQQNVRQILHLQPPSQLTSSYTFVAQ